MLDGYSLITIQAFDRQVKRIIKNILTKSELISLFKSLEEYPELGGHIGNGCFKIRLAIASKGKGKSGGARVITHVYVEQETIYLLSIYDKSEQENISEITIKNLLSLIKNE